MKILPKITAINLLFISIFIFSTCGKPAENSAYAEETSSDATQGRPQQDQTNSLPDLQKEILTSQNTLTVSPIGNIDFKNFSYPLPRGWQDSDGGEVELQDGLRRMSKERIGVSYLTTKFGDVTGDGADEAFVILKIETAGAAIPQVVYVYTLKDGVPDLIWHFRTGDRADGGLKRIYSEAGSLFIELFGQDRYILGEVETSQIDGDEPQLCCPKHFTRTHYKWNGANFRMEGSRETFSTTDENILPVENMINKTEKENSGTKK